MNLRENYLSTSKIKTRSANTKKYGSVANNPETTESYI